MPVWINSNNDDAVKEFFTEVSFVKLVSNLSQVVLHHPFTDHMDHMIGLLASVSSSYRGLYEPI